MMGNGSLEIHDADKDARPYQIIGNSLLDRIRTGEFRTSGKLPTERELAESYSVGRAVVRDALVMLEVKGLIQTRQGSGIYITLKAYEAQRTASVAKPLPAGGPLELLSARQMIEGQIARQAATNATDADIRRIEEAFNTHINTPDSEARDEADRALHIAIASATQNPELVAIANHLWERRQHQSLWTGLNLRLNEFQHRDKWVADHNAILEAIQRRDPEGAYVAMWQHIENVKQVYRAHIPTSTRASIKGA